MKTSLFIIVVVLIEEKGFRVRRVLNPQNSKKDIRAHNACLLRLRPSLQLESIFILCESTNKRAIRLMAGRPGRFQGRPSRSEEHTSELQSLMRISYAVFCLKKKIKIRKHKYNHSHTY